MQSLEILQSYLLLLIPLHHGRYYPRIHFEHGGVVLPNLPRKVVQMYQTQSPLSQSLILELKNPRGSKSGHGGTYLADGRKLSPLIFLPESVVDGTLYIVARNSAGAVPRDRTVSTISF